MNGMDGAPAPADAPRMPLGFKIGIAVGLAGGLIGIGAAVASVAWPGGTGGASEMCAKAAACCRKMAGTSPAAATCEGYTKQGGPTAEKLCEDTVKSYRQAGVCK
jgi:hypothetical protein